MGYYRLKKCKNETPGITIFKDEMRTRNKDLDEVANENDSLGYCCEVQEKKVCS